MSEILGTLFKYLLALLAITAVVVVLYEALGSNKVSQTMSDVTSLQANISQLYAGTNGSAFDSTPADLINAGVVPSNMVSGTSIIGPWGNPVTITSPTAGQVTISFAAIPTAACTKLVMSLSSVMSSIYVGSSKASGTPTTTAGTAPALNTVTTACAASASVPVTFAFTANVAPSTGSTS